MPRIRHVAIFGATGMVGQGMLRRLLADAEIETVCAIGRSPVALAHPKLEQITRADLTQYAGLEARFAHFDAVFFCVGISAFRMQEAAYKAVNYDTALGAARALQAAHPQAPFIYVSAKGADSTLQSTTMWQRVRGQIEHDLQAISPQVRMFRPGMIVPQGGIVSRTWTYRVLYAALKPVLPLLRYAMPAWVTTSDELANAMLHVARHSYPDPIIESGAFAALARAP